VRTLFHGQEFARTASLTKAIAREIPNLDNAYGDPLCERSPSPNPRVKGVLRLALPDHFLGKANIHALVPVKVSNLPIAYEVARGITMA